MKKIFLLGIMLSMLSAPAAAQLPTNAYFGLFVDADRTDWCLSGTGMHTMYLVVLPSETGLVCVELSTAVVGEGVMFFAPTYHPDYAPPAMGAVPGNFGFCFQMCKWDWTYVYSVGMYVTGTDPISIEIGGWVPDYGLTGPPLSLDCGGLPPNDPKDALEIPAIPFTTFYINGCGPIAVEQSSWGAIKSLYK